MGGLVQGGSWSQGGSVGTGPWRRKRPSRVAERDVAEIRLETYGKQAEWKRRLVLPRLRAARVARAVARAMPLRASAPKV